MRVNSLWLNYMPIKSQNKRRNEYENYSDERFKNVEARNISKKNKDLFLSKWVWRLVDDIGHESTIQKWKKLAYWLKHLKMSKKVAC